MGRGETDWGRAGGGSWACWAALHARPKTAGLESAAQPAPEARRADPT